MSRDGFSTRDYRHLREPKRPNDRPDRRTFSRQFQHSTIPISSSNSSATSASTWNTHPSTYRERSSPSSHSLQSNDAEDDNDDVGDVDDVDDVEEGMVDDDDVCYQVQSTSPNSPPAFATKKSR